MLVAKYLILFIDKEVWFILNTLVGCISWRETQLTMNINLFPSLLSWHKNMILAFETDVLQASEKNQPVLYNIVKLSRPSVSCEVVWILFWRWCCWIGWKASYVYITLHCLFCEILWSSRIYVLHTGTKYWPKVSVCWQNNILIYLVCDTLIIYSVLHIKLLWWSHSNLQYVVGYCHGRSSIVISALSFLF